MPLGAAYALGSRCKFLKGNGLIISDVDEIVTLYPNVIAPGELNDCYDLVILATKAMQLKSAIDAVRHLSKGVFLPLLNGFKHLDALDQLFGKDRVMAGVAQIMSMIMPDGSMQSFNEMHSLTIGHRVSAHKPLAASFFEICTKSAYDYYYSDNIEQSLWYKWTFLASLAGITTLLHASIGAISETLYGRELSSQIYGECCAIAEQCGFGVSSEIQDKTIKELSKYPSILTSSMLRDLTNGQQTEHDYILNDLIQRGVTHSTSCTLLKLAFTHMSLLQKNKKS